MFIEKPTQFAKIIIPEESVHSWAFYTKEYLIPYKRILQNIIPFKYEKVYLTRTKLNQGVICFNEKYFENYFKEKGFVIIAPEQYTITEQICIVAGANEIVTTLGSLSHFAMFCKKGTRYTLLARVDDDVLTSQCLVNEASGVDWYIVDVSLNFLFASRTYGVNQIGITKYWKSYIWDMYNEVIENGTIQDSSYEYLMKWCEYYAHINQYKKIADKEPFDFLNRMHKVLYGKELEKSKYDLGIARVDLNIKVQQLEHYIEELLQEKIMYARMQAIIEYYQCALEELKVNRPRGLFHKYKLEQNKIINQVLEKATGDKSRPVLMCKVHLSSIGCKKEEVEGTICGDIVKNYQIEAVKFYFDSSIIHVFYTTSSGAGIWDKEVTDGQISGTTGKHRALKGICIRLDFDASKDYVVIYRVYSSDTTWSEWKCDNEKIYVQNENLYKKLFK